MSRSGDDRKDRNGQALGMEGNTSSVKLYLERCRTFNMTPDPTVLVCLETEWHLLSISPSLATEGALLPLVDVLTQNSLCTHIRELRVVPAPNLRWSRQQTFSGDVDARCLHEILARNNTLIDVEVSHIGLGPTGIHELASMLKLNSTLQVLRICNNPGGRLAYASLEAALKQNSTLRLLDVSSNRLGYDAIQRLRVSGKRKGHGDDLHVVSHGNHVVEEMLNALTHGVGFIIAFFAVIVLLWNATSSMLLWWTCLIYGVSLLSMYAGSTMFHACFDTDHDSHAFWNMCDHSSIYLLIAGGGMPIILVTLPHSWTALIVTAIQWTIACCGIVFGMYAMHHRLRYRLAVELILYLSQGFIALVLYEEILVFMRPEWIQLMKYFAGCYLFGLLFFLAEHAVHPVLHAVWHVFVILGSTFHYILVLQFAMAQNVDLPASTQLVCRIDTSQVASSSFW